MQWRVQVIGVLPSPLGDSNAMLKFENEYRDQRHSVGVAIGVAIRSHPSPGQCQSPILLLANKAKQTHKVFVMAFQVHIYLGSIFTCLTSFAPPLTVPGTHFPPVTEARLASASTHLMELLPLAGTFFLRCPHGSIPHILQIISSGKPAPVTQFVTRFTPTKGTTHSCCLVYFPITFISI